MARDDDVLHEVRAMRGELGAIQIEQARQGDEQRRQGERIAQIELVVVGDGGEDKLARGTSTLRAVPTTRGRGRPWRTTSSRSS